MEMMKAKEKASPKFNKGHEELPERKSYSPHIPLQDQSEKSLLLRKDLTSLVRMRMEGSAPVLLVSPALQIPPRTAAEMIKPQVCLEGSFSSGMFGRLFSSSSRSPLCLR